MRRSKQVPLTLLAAAALAAIGCHDQPRHCVDAQNHILPDAQCPVDENHSTGYYGGHYIYGGSSGGHVGDAVVGGSTSSSGASFGGFGHGGGEGGGGEGGGE